MLFEVNEKRGQYAESLRALIDEYMGDCHEGYMLAFMAVRRLADLLEVGKLDRLRPTFRHINKRLFGTRNSRVISDQHADVRKKIRVMRAEAKKYAQDPELAELVYVLTTVNRVLGISPDRTTLFSDRVTRGSYVQYFHDVVIAAINAVLLASTPADPVRETA